VRSPSLSSDSGNSTDEEKAIHDDYVHPTSLKAWKQKKDKEMQEQEPQVKGKRPQSGGRSAKVKSPKGAEKPAKPPSPREKSPKGGKSKRPTSATAAEKLAVGERFSKTVYHFPSLRQKKRYKNQANQLNE
jgi:hypothetical protein